MRLYLWVTKDKYELPLYVADKAVELAKVSGYSIESVYGLLSRYRLGKIKQSPFICVEVE